MRMFNKNVKRRPAPVRRAVAQMFEAMEPRQMFAVIAAWETSGLSGYGPSPFAPATSDAGVTVVGLTRGSGLATTGTAASNAWGGTGFSTTSASLATGISENDFATFQITPNPGSQLSLSGIDAYNIRRSNTGPTTGQWQFSTDGTNYTNIGTAITWGSTTSSAGNNQAAISLSGIAALQNVSSGTTITFRIVDWGATGASGTWYINNRSVAGSDLVINGTVDAVAATPAVTSLSPSSGTTAGGNNVTINGTNLTGATSVTFGATSIPAANFVSSSATQIVVTAPASAAGTVDVLVTTASGTSANTATDDYTYTAAPIVSGLTPAAGPTTGGNAVTISGSAFTGVTEVSFGGTIILPAAFVSSSDTEIVVTAPAGAEGLADVTVTTSIGGTSATNPAAQYAYVGVPTVSSVTPNSGASGTVVTIDGTGFLPGTTVTFGGTPADSIVINSLTSITATAPVGTGTVDVVVNNGVGDSTPVSYTYPTIAVGFTGNYSQDFNGLSSTTWANGTTLAGWSLFRRPAPGTAITAIAISDGSSNSGSFYSFGAAGDPDRALGGVGSGGTYFGSPATGAVAGWIALALTNNTASDINAIDLGFSGEQWRNGGNASAQTMSLEYGIGATFEEIAWAPAGSSFGFTSVVNSATAATVDGNTDGKITGLGGTLSGLGWTVGSNLWVRWVETNDTGNDHGLAIDDVSVAVATADLTNTSLDAFTSFVASGSPVTFSGSVSNTSTSTDPVGTISIVDGSTILASGIAVSGSGTGTVTFSSPVVVAVGEYTNISAVFVPTDTAVFASSASSPGQPLTVTNYVNVTSATTPYTQNFDSLGSTVGAWSNQSTIPGWSLYRNGTTGSPVSPVVPVTALNVGTGSSNTGGVYNFGLLDDADRAVGSVGSNGFGGADYAVGLTNNTGSPVTAVTIKYDGEQWRDNGVANTLTLQYAFGDTISGVGSWTDAGTAFNFTTPLAASATGTAVNGNIEGLVANIGGSLDLSSSPWAVGSNLLIRWVDPNDGGADAGVAIDNVSITAGQVGTTFTSVNSTAFLAGAAGSFVVTTTASPTASVVLTSVLGPNGVTALPATLTFTPDALGGGTLAGTPDSADAGVYTLVFTASSSGNPDVTQTFSLAVNAKISITSTSPNYSQNFDGLGTVGQSFTNLATLPGFALYRDGTGTTNGSNTLVSSLPVSNGSANAGAVYNFGTTDATDRAVGSLASGAFGGSSYSFALVNDTDASITSVGITYDGEQWRDGGSGTFDPTFNSLVLQYGYGDAFENVTWNAPGAAFDFTAPVANTGSGAALDGNDPLNRVEGLGGALDLTAEPWTVGTTLWVRWVDTNDLGNDQGLAIDNVTISTAPATLPAWLDQASVATWDAGTQTLNVTGAATIISDPGLDAPVITVQSTGSLSIAPATDTVIKLGGLTLVADATATVAGTNPVVVLGTVNGPVTTFSIDPTSTLDLGASKVIVHNSSTTIQNVVPLLQSAYVGNGSGLWTGTGFTSSVAEADTSKSIGYSDGANLLALSGNITDTWNGQTVGADSLLFTLSEDDDTNLDGLVDGADASNLIEGYSLGLTGWQNGDLNYDGAVTPADYQLFDGPGLRPGSPNVQSLPTLAIVGGPLTNITAGQTLSTLTVQLSDASIARANVSVSILAGPSGSSLLGKTKVAVKNGQAVFSNLSIRKAGTYTLEFANTGYTSATTSFTVVAGAAKKIVFSTAPAANLTASSTFGTTVSVVDRYGNTVADSNSVASIVLVGKAKNSSLLGSASTTLTNGNAAFSDLAITAPGTYSLGVTVGKLRSISAKFLVS